MALKKRPRITLSITRLRRGQSVSLLICITILQLGENLALHAFAFGAIVGNKEIKPNLLGDAGPKRQAQGEHEPPKSEHSRHLGRT